MGCILSSEAIDDGGQVIQSPVPPGDTYVYVPGFRVPKEINLTEILKGRISAGLAVRLQALRSQVIAIESGKTPTSVKLTRRKSDLGTPGSSELEKALLEYLPVLLGFVTGGEKLSSGVVYEWMNVEDENQDSAAASGYFELLSVLHLLGMLALQEANSCLTPRPPADGYNLKANAGMCFALHPIFSFGRYISANFTWYRLSDENKRNAIEIFLKAASYCQCAITSVLPNIPEEIKAKLPADLTEPMLRTMEQQAIGQGVELQLGFAIDNVQASLAVKRRLACEQVKAWEQANEQLGQVPLAKEWKEKHLRFIKWKLAEAKAGAYYFHGLILDEGMEDDVHAQALVCLKASYSFLRESQKARSDFSTMEPFTKIAPLWGPMKYLTSKIPRELLSKERMFRDLYQKEKLPATTPELPDFPLALTAEPFTLPPVDPAWKKEPGYEPKPSLTPNVPAFLAKRNQAQKQAAASDLRRARPMSPPLLVTPEMVESR